MRRRLTSGNVAALVLGALMLAERTHAHRMPPSSGICRASASSRSTASTSRACSSSAADLPANGATWSSFRQVLSTEAELTLFPDGFGPFDSMFMFTRFLVSYDCIYTHACWTGQQRRLLRRHRRNPAIRQPLSLKEDVKNNSPYFAGLLKQTYRPGSLAPAREKLNPGRRYRDCENPPGVFSNPWPLAVFCNLNNASPLDGPIQGGTATS